MPPSRIVATDGAPNLRDLGGLPALAGRRVRPGRLYRSDDLSALSDADLGRLADLGIRTVIDFRDRSEAAAAPDRFPRSVRNRIAIPIEAGRLMRGLAGDSLTRTKSEGIMISVYRALINDFQAAFRDFFAVAADPEMAPVLFHCTAGKDRTGVAAALVLAGVGVEPAVIMEDYLLSNHCLQKKYVQDVDYDETTAPLYGVAPEYLQAAFEVLDNRFGGANRFLTENLRLDLPAFAASITA
ncbi:MAG: tyrosine-protein phosphatase [Planctomycetes bacterium]|nr:tyrosine-protein phosphatase [Planctomycetota bacterium]